MNLTQHEALYSFERDCALLEDITTDLTAWWKDVKDTPLTMMMARRLVFAHDRLYRISETLNTIRRDAAGVRHAVEEARGSSWPA